MKKLLNIKGLKYIVVLVLFAVYLLFLDDYSVVATSRLKRQVRELHAEEQALKEAIVSDSINAATLRDNLDAKERYGRENYYMKCDNEDIFVIK
ncbi:MAG: septum formation initiator family protein [Bacteroidales bacterium]|nr:septum formation initiator family protein [Bacteroidales bacterium]